MSCKAGSPQDCGLLFVPLYIDHLEHIIIATMIKANPFLDPMHAYPFSKASHHSCRSNSLLLRRSSTGVLPSSNSNERISSSPLVRLRRRESPGVVSSYKQTDKQGCQDLDHDSCIRKSCSSSKARLESIRRNSSLQWYSHSPEIISKLSELVSQLEDSSITSNESFEVKEPVVEKSYSKAGRSQFPQEYLDLIQDDLELEESLFQDSTSPASSSRSLSSSRDTLPPIIIQQANILRKSFNQDSGLTIPMPKLILTVIKSLPGNDRCFDCNCNDPNELNWASIPHGTILCDECSIEHMEYVGESDILSFTDLDWKIHEIVALLEGGNDAFLNYLAKFSCVHGELFMLQKALQSGNLEELYGSLTARQYSQHMKRKVKSVLHQTS